MPTVGEVLQEAAALHRAGRLEEARVRYEVVLQHAPGQPHALHMLALVHDARGESERARDLLEEAVRVSEPSAPLLANLGGILERTGRRAQALPWLERALGLDPEGEGVRLSLASTLHNLGREERALEVLAPLLRSPSPSAPVLHLLGLIRAARGETLAALQAYQRAHARDPEHAGARYNLAHAWLEEDLPDRARPLLETCLERDPNDHRSAYALAQIDFAEGRFQAGAARFEARWRCPGGPRPPRLDTPLWDGSPPAGRLLLVAEQGLGDTVMMARLARDLARRHASVVHLRVQRPLVRLLRRVAEIEVSTDPEPIPEHAAWLPLMSLLGTLAPQLDSLPPRRGWLPVPPPHSGPWDAVLARPVRRIAVHWQGNASFLHDERRSFPLSCLAALAAVPGVELISVQKGAGTEQIASCGFRVHTFGEALDARGAFVDSAAILARCELVVTSDTALAHVAGALGVPTWLALGTPCEWRWGRSGSTTPWYPSMRLWRQPRPGGWPPLFAAMARELAATAPARPRAAQGEV